VYYNPVLNENFEKLEDYTCTDMVTDGTYLYAGKGVSFHKMSTGYLGTRVYADGVEQRIPSYVHVYDRDLNEVVRVEVNAEPYSGNIERFSLAILEDMVYMQTASTVYACTLEEFLMGGQPPFQPLYNHEGVEYSAYYGQ